MEPRHFVLVLGVLVLLWMAYTVGKSDGRDEADRGPSDREHTEL
jgi:threonine/homoserine/homoserine lactone efflux protein